MTNLFWALANGHLEQSGAFSVTLRTDADGVRLPSDVLDRFRAAGTLRLDIDLNHPRPPENLELGAGAHEGISVCLTFSGRPFDCYVPWEAVTLIADTHGDGLCRAFPQGEGHEAWLAVGPRGVAFIGYVGPGLTLSTRPPDALEALKNLASRAPAKPPALDDDGSSNLLKEIDRQLNKLAREPQITPIKIDPPAPRRRGRPAPPKPEPKPRAYFSWPRAIKASRPAWLHAIAGGGDRSFKGIPNLRLIQGGKV